MKTFSKYKSYKPSGIEWLGEIPEHWEVRKFNAFANIVEGQVDPEQEPYRDLVLIAPNHIESGTGNLFYKETAKDQNAESGKYLFQKGDVIYSKIRPALKKVWLSDCVGICSADMYPIRTKKKDIYSKYFTYLLLTESFSDFMIATSMRVAMPKINRDDFHQCLFALPPLSEQIAIANYLDSHTAQIDKKIELLVQKAESYKKLKQSLINEVVTGKRQLTTKPSRMKDSGIDWIGDIPEHWDVKRLKDVCHFITCGLASTPEYVDEIDGVPFLSAQNVRPYKMNLSKYSYISKQLHGQLTKYRKPKRNDILVTRVGAGIGDACLVDIDMEFSVYVSLTHIRVNTMTSSNYLVYIFGTTNFSFLCKSGTPEGGGQGNLNVKNVNNFLFYIPPLLEQIAIAKYLDEKTAQIDQIIETIGLQVDKLKELRKTLINDVVTGEDKGG